MPPKFKVTKNEILAAAFSLLETGGKPAVTSRAIAERLGISSRPIYSFFPSMESLFEALLSQAVGVMKEYMNRPFTPDSFLNSGVGYVLFVNEHTQVADYIEQYSNTPIALVHDSSLFDELYAKVQKDPNYQGISREDFFGIYEKTSIFTYGLVEYLRSTKSALTVPEIITRLNEAGEAFIVHHIWTKMGRKKEY